MSEQKYLKTALYCRSAQANDNAVAIQERMLRQCAEKNAYENPSCYIDNGASGSTLDRPAMNRLISDICSGDVKTVIVTGPDRIARGLETMCRWEALLKEHDVKCITVDTGEDGLSGGFAFGLWLLQHISSELSEHQKSAAHASSSHIG